MNHLHGYKVTSEGKLHFWCFPNSNLYVPEVSGPVPDQVVLEGAESVERYVAHQVHAAVRSAETAYLERLRKLDEVRVPVEVLHEQVLLRGVVVNTLYGGQAVWDVHLTEPLGFEGKDTLYRRKYPVYTSGNELLTDELKPSNYAIDLARKMLVKVYEKRKHERRFPIAYKVYYELECRKDAPGPP